MIASMSRDFIVNRMNLSHVTAIENMSLNTLRRWWDTSILPLVMAGTFKEVHFVLRKISFQSSLKMCELAETDRQHKTQNTKTCHLFCTHLGTGSNDLFLMPTTFREHTEFQTADRAGPLFSFSCICTLKGHGHICRVNNGCFKFADFVLIVQATLCQGTNFGEYRFLSRYQAEQVEKVAALLYKPGSM
jgi:hypothetical protein